jgi:DNA-binding NarL/FixJ family response regulator
VLQLIADGLRTRQIAQRLLISQETIKSYVWNIAFKLGATNRTHAVTIALRAGLID